MDNPPWEEVDHQEEAAEVEAEAEVEKEEEKEAEAEADLHLEAEAGAEREPEEDEEVTVEHQVHHQDMPIQNRQHAMYLEFLDCPLQPQRRIWKMNSEVMAVLRRLI